MNLNKENVLKVCDALESGKYRQGFGRLHRYGMFCCLGVACDVSGLAKWSDDGVYCGKTISLPQNVVNWLGFDENLGPAVCDIMSSAHANDSGKSFYDIAAAWRELVAKI